MSSFAEWAAGLIMPGVLTMYAGPFVGSADLAVEWMAGWFSTPAGQGAEDPSAMINAMYSQALTGQISWETAAAGSQALTAYAQATKQQGYIQQLDHMAQTSGSALSQILDSAGNAYKNAGEGVLKGGIGIGIVGLVGLGIYLSVRH